MRDFIDSYLIYIKIAGVIILCLAAWYAWHQFTDHFKEIGRVEVREELQPKLDAEILKTKSLSSAIEIQNNHIANLGIEAEAAQKRFLEADKKAKAISVQAANRIKRLQSVPVRSSPNLSCQDELKDIKSLLDEAHR